MRLFIQHHTHYQYDDAPKNLIQLLRLTPRAGDAHQRTVEWHIDSPGSLTPFIDAFGNQSHTHILAKPLSDLHLRVHGVVDIEPLMLGRLSEDAQQNSIPALTYLVPTHLTTAAADLNEFALSSLPQGLRHSDDALQLAAALCEKVQYLPGNTDVTSTAAQAFTQSKGVCQDHAHIMIAACRALGVPARYVSGYVDPGNSHAAASHAWVDVYVNAQWHSIDVTNSIYASDSHCRLAVGRDYLDACPIRGVRAGGHTEHLDVEVTVTTSASAQQ
jgi:transglutaminase-like putative cysteine protease